MRPGRAPRRALSPFGALRKVGQANRSNDSPLASVNLLGGPWTSPDLIAQLAEWSCLALLARCGGHDGNYRYVIVRIVILC